MKFYYSYRTEQMSASAPCANAGTSCAHSADTAMIAILDAIVMASIIIYGMITLLCLRPVALLVALVLVVGLAGLVSRGHKTPWCDELAI